MSLFQANFFVGSEVREEDRITNFHDALGKLAALEDFSQRSGCDSMTKILLDLRTIMEKSASQGKMLKQRTLMEVWKN